MFLFVACTIKVNERWTLQNGNTVKNNTFEELNFVSVNSCCKDLNMPDKACGDFTRLQEIAKQNKCSNVDCK